MIYTTMAVMFAFNPSAQDRGQSNLPEELRKTYEGLIKAFEAADVQEIQGFALKGAVTITSDERKENREYGADINLPFLKNGFSKKIVSILEAEDGTCLLRTATSGLYFVSYRNGWKLYRYLDKPIE